MKIKIKKYQGGGLIGSIYQPVTVTETPSYSAQLAINLLGGQGVGASASSSSSSSKSGSSKDSLTEKGLFDLYNSLKDAGLQNDTDAIVKLLQQDVFTDNLLNPFGTTSDLSSKYLKAISYINRAKTNLKLYEDAYTLVKEKGAMDEVAITNDGKVVALDRKRNIMKPITVEEYKANPELYELQTNGNLLYERQVNPTQAFNNTIIDVVNNGTSMQEIEKHVTQFLQDVGKDSIKREGYSDELAKGLTGLEQLVDKYGASVALDLIRGGDLYKIGIQEDNNTAQISKAYKALIASLKPSEITLLKLKGEEVLLNLFDSKINRTSNITMDQNSDGETGTKRGLVSSKGQKEEQGDINFALQLYGGLNSQELTTFALGEGGPNAFKAYARNSKIATAEGKLLGENFPFKELMQSQIANICRPKTGTFGNVPLNQNRTDLIIIEDSDVSGVDLPYTVDARGRIIPDFNLLTKIREADEEILKANLDPNNPEDLQKMNAIYESKKLPVKWKSAEQLTDNYKRFAVIRAIASEDALDGQGLNVNGTLEEIVDDDAREAYVKKVQETSGDKNYSLSKGLFKKKRLYRSSLFIEITGTLMDAAMATPHNVKTGSSKDYTGYRAKEAITQYNAVPQDVTIEAQQAQ